ncbi:MAG TPA: hypothetical protein VJ653_06140, partial [Acidimicrobiales bacterium]|nr:hypothetical protein [Acidimicrobiales bacterium]
MRTKRPYLLVAAGLLGVYVVAAVALLATKDFDDKGPLSFHAEALEGSPPPAVTQGCYPKAERVKVVSAVVRGKLYFACYSVDAGNGSVLGAKVVDSQGFAVTDAGLIKEAGAWPWIATVDNATDLVFGAVALAVILGMGWLYGRRGRPREPASGPWWARPWALAVLALLPIVGWIALAALPNVERRRKARAALQAVFIFAGFILFGLLSASATAGDTWGLVVNALLAAGLAVAVVGSRTLR